MSAGRETESSQRAPSSPSRQEASSAAHGEPSGAHRQDHHRTAEQEPSSARQRRFQARHRLLLDVAARIAEEEGWQAVTTRRLAGEIGYSQPVIYSHFAGLEHLVADLVVDGFGQMRTLIEDVVAERVTEAQTLERLIVAYIEFGRARPQLYAAMFSSTTSVRFAHPDSPVELRATFEALTTAVAGDRPVEDAIAVTELFWACCHGLTTLLLSARIPEDRIGRHIERIVELVRGRPAEPSAPPDGDASS